MHIAYYIRELLAQPNASLARRYLGITAGGGSVQFSAGSLSQLRSDLTFADSNGVTFGLNTNGVVTASVGAAGGGLTNIKVSAGTLSALRSDITFSNGSGVTWGLNAGGVVTASVRTDYQSAGAYLTTAMASDAGSNFLAATAVFAGTNATGTIASNGLSVSVAAQSVQSLKFSAGTLSALRSDLTFGDGNGVTFGLDAAGVVTASVAAGLTAFPRLDQVLDPNTDKVFSMGGNVLQFSWATGGSISTNATRMGLFELDFQGHITSDGDLMHIHEHSPNPGTIDLVHIEASGADVTCLRLNAAASIAAEVNKPVKFLMSANTSPFILDSNASSVVASLNADLLDGKHSSELGGAVVFSAGTESSALASVVFSNSNNVSFGLSNGTITASANVTAPAPITLSQFLAQPYMLNVLGMAWVSNLSIVAPFQLPNYASFGFLRFMYSYVMAVPNTYSTSGAPTTYSFGQWWTTYANIYSLGTGASSNSWMSVNSASAAMTMVFEISQSSSSYTMATSVTFPQSGGTSVFTTTMSTNRTNVSWTTSGLSGFTQLRFVDLPYSQSLSPGYYAMVVGVSSTTSTQAQSTLFTMTLAQSLVCMSQTNNAFGEFMGTRSDEFPFGAGRLSSNVAGTVPAFDMDANMVSTQANPLIYWQGLNRA